MRREAPDLRLVDLGDLDRKIGIAPKDRSRAFYTVELGDGRHAAGQVIDHFNFTFNFKQTRSVVTSVQQEAATLYSADDQPIGTITVHVTHHVMWSDLDGNFEPDPDEITAEVDKVKVTCP